MSMAEYAIIKNNKAPVKCVFDYMEAEELKNPLPHQAELLKQICDGVEFVESAKWRDVLKNMKKGDYLYLVESNKLNLTAIATK
jgi:hypothetical protein